MNNESKINIKLSFYCLLVLIIISSCGKKNEVAPAHSNLPFIHWKAGDDIIVTEDLYIDSVNFIIEPGVKVKIRSGCNIIIGKNYSVKLMAIGTGDNPINFTTYNPEGLPDKSYWGSIIINNLYNEPAIPTFEYCNFIKGGGQGSEAVIINQSNNINFSNCLIDYSLNYGILAKNNAGFNEFTGNTIKHTLNHPVSITSGKAHTIGINNIIIADSTNQGIFLSTGNLNIGYDSIIWRAQTVPYIIPNDFSVTGSTVVSSFFIIEGGTTIMLGENSNFYVGDRLKFIAIGYIEKPITFTSLQKEPQPGDWSDIRFNHEANAVFKYCIFEYGGEYEDHMVDNAMIRLYSTTNISMDNCLFRYSESIAVLLYKYGANLSIPSFSSFTNNTFENLNTYAISLQSESVNSIDYTNNFNNHEIYIQESTISSGHTIWKNLGSAYILDSYVTINGEFETILEIEKGTKVKFDRGGIKIGTASSYGGKLIAVGTEEEPIIFTSAKENPDYGDWGGILFYKYSRPGNILNHCEILYAGEYSLNFNQASVHISGNDTNVSVMNSTIAHSSHYGLIVSGSANPYLFNNTFFDNLE